MFKSKRLSQVYQQFSRFYFIFFLYRKEEGFKKQYSRYFDKSFSYFTTLTLLQQTVEGLFSNLFLFRLQASVYDIYMTLTALK